MKRKIVIAGIVFAIILVISLASFIVPITAYMQLEYFPSTNKYSEKNNALYIKVANQNQKSETAFAENTSTGTKTNNSTSDVIKRTSDISNLQLWIDKLSNIKIRFNHFPPYPFVGNNIQLSFKVTDLKTDRPLEIMHVHLFIIKNVTANFNKTGGEVNKNDFLTFDNIETSNGAFSLMFKFEQEGTHQIIVKLNTNDGRVSLASFGLPVLIQE
ncbi:MAG: hypothetical protein JO297_07475 [Nitrososphaeraceae archaeon]|nr:hypothetical protein [Nitrososphaeraceae archaeon]